MIGTGVGVGQSANSRNGSAPLEISPASTSTSAPGTGAIKRSPGSARCRNSRWRSETSWIFMATHSCHRAKARTPGFVWHPCLPIDRLTRLRRSSEDGCPHHCGTASLRLCHCTSCHDPCDAKGAPAHPGQCAGSPRTLELAHRSGGRQRQKKKWSRTVSYTHLT